MLLQKLLYNKQKLVALTKFIMLLLILNVRKERNLNYVNYKFIWQKIDGIFDRIHDI